MNRRRPSDANDAWLWVAEARDHLKIARKHEPDLNLRLLCSEAHLGAEKAIKSVIIARSGDFPYTHDIGVLLDRAEQLGETIPDGVRKKETLTIYSGSGRYPNTGDEREATTREEYQDAVDDATAIVDWAVRRVESLSSEAGEAETDLKRRPATANADGETDST